MVYFLAPAMRNARLPVRGCKDLLPSAAAARRSLVSRFANFARTYGFVEVDTPIIERSDLYASTLGLSSDIVSSELFNVSGPTPKSESGDGVAMVLRPEGTAGIARAFAPQSPGHFARVWHVGPMFRYERPQRLRLRQFTQLGVECMGETSLHSDIDCIALADHLVRGVNGGSQSTLVLNTLGTVTDRQLYNEALHKWLAPRYSSLSAVSRARFDSGKCLRILDSKLSEDEDAVTNGPSLAEYVTSSERDRFQLLQELLIDENIPFVIDRTLVRGLEYYTSTAFEFVDGTGRAVCAGGRYDNVQGTHGVGFAAGVERLMTLDADMDDTSSEHSDDIKSHNGLDERVGGFYGGVAVIAWTSGKMKSSTQEALARTALRSLRKAGLSGCLRVVSNKLGKAVGRAVKDGASAVWIIGDDEVSQDAVRVKLVIGTTYQERQPERVMSVEEAISNLRDQLRTHAQEIT